MSREQSAVIKGIAILLMLIYHLNNIPGIQGLDTRLADTLITASHPINYFILVSGYGLYCAYRQGRLTWSYLFRRALKLYLAFWLVLMIFVLGIGTVFYPGRFDLSWDVLLVNFLAWRWDYCIFTWFLFPYVLMTLTAKWVFQLVDRLGAIISVVIAVLSYLAVAGIVSRFLAPLMSLYHALNHLVVLAQSLPVLMVGAVAARCVLSGRSLIWNWLFGKNWLTVVLLLASFAVRGQIHSMVLNPFHATFVCWLVLHLTIEGWPRRAFVELGNKSMPMWFSQGFLAVVMLSEYYLLLHWPLLIWVVWLLVCYFVSCLLITIVNLLTRHLNL